ncbi:MAG: hypothetical protein AAF962_21735 [Actinomycetota bacterium]
MASEESTESGVQAEPGVRIIAPDERLTPAAEAALRRRSDEELARLAERANRRR